ncbi:MAG TPA: patatin-like phospholipase family protein [Longimicrobiales bacterium]
MRTILVLGGGGVKGMTHAGAWRALCEAGVEITEVVGTSIGALVGACIAGGQSFEDLSKAAMALKKADIVLLNRWTVLLNGIRQTSVFQSEPLHNYITSLVPQTSFEEFSIPIQVNAVDLENGDIHWFGAGGRSDVSPADAIYASCALPLFYPPAEIDGRYYVDGGVVDSLPVLRAADRGADLIIAIDAGATKTRDSLDTVNKGMIAIHHRVTEIMGYRRKRSVIDNWQGPQLIYVRPALHKFSTFDFGQTEFFLEEGYRSTKAALEGAGVASG